MLCSNCHKNEATVHFTTVVGESSETVDLCTDCAPGGASCYPSSLDQAQKLSVVGRTCEFCGEPAFSGERNAAGGATYWCLECGAELGRMISELLASARPDVVQKIRDASSWMAFVRDPQLQAWAETVTAKAVSMLKERKRKHGGNAGS